MTTSLFVSCMTALEPLLVEELKALGIPAVHPSYRGVYVDQWDWNTVYKINYASRLASRVLLPLMRFKCFNRQSLYDEVFRFNWLPLIKPNDSIAIDANVQHPQLRNSLFAAQVVKDAICDQLREKAGRRPSIDLQNPDIQLNLYIHRGVAVLSFDTSGVPLHKRGYRQEAVEAPMQETLAAAILKISGYQGEEVLLDPCCGSGTILIEAALMATQTPPGYLRKQWGFMRHPDYVATDWLKVRNELDSHRRPLAPRKIFGADISREAVRITKVNLKAAGFGQQIEVVQADFREFEPSVAPTLVIVNPPHGKRLDDEERLQPLYRALGDFIKRKSAKPSRGFIFTSNLNLSKEVGLAAKKRYVLNSGGLESRLLEFEIY